MYVCLFCRILGLFGKKSMVNRNSCAEYVEEKK